VFRFGTLFAAPESTGDAVKISFAAAVMMLLVVSNAAADTSDDAALAHARKLLAATILIDGHNDLPWEVRVNKAHPQDVDAYDLRGAVAGQTDLERLRAGRVGAQFWSVYVPGELPGGFAKVQLEQLDIARRRCTAV
jgi:membrane dipeptidase